MNAIFDKNGKQVKYYLYMLCTKICARNLIFNSHYKSVNLPSLC